jgi:hypothetical protein
MIKIRIKLFIYALLVHIHSYQCNAFFVSSRRRRATSSPGTISKTIYPPPVYTNSPKNDEYSVCDIGWPNCAFPKNMKFDKTNFTCVPGNPICPTTVSCSFDSSSYGSKYICNAGNIKPQQIVLNAYGRVYRNRNMRHISSPPKYWISIYPQTLHCQYVNITNSSYPCEHNIDELYNSSINLSVYRFNENDYSIKYFRRLYYFNRTFDDNHTITVMRPKQNQFIFVLTKNGSGGWIIAILIVIFCYKTA